MKRGREYHGYWEEYNVEKGEMGSNIIFPIILRLLGRILIEVKGWVGKNIKLWGTLYTLLHFSLTLDSQEMYRNRADGGGGQYKPI